MTDELFFNLIFYGLLFFGLIIGLVSVIVAQVYYRFDFSEDDLRLIQKKCKKKMIIFFIIILLLPLILVPLNMAFPKLVRLFLFIVLFLNISFSLVFTSSFLRYWSIRRELQRKAGGNDEKMKDG